MSAKESGSKIVFTAKIGNFTASSNLSVVLNYIYDRDIKNPYSPYEKVNMQYDKNTHLWKAEIDKKYDSATIHYWINVTDYGSSNTTSYGPDEISYKPRIDINYAPYVLVIFFGLFLLFEIMMRYGVIKRRSPPEDEEEEETGTTENPSEPQK